MASPGELFTYICDNIWIDAGSLVADFCNIEVTERVQLIDETCHLSSMRMGSKPPGVLTTPFVLVQRYSGSDCVRKGWKGAVYAVVDDSYLDIDTAFLLGFVEIQEIC